MKRIASGKHLYFFIVATIIIVGIIFFLLPKIYQGTQSRDPSGQGSEGPIDDRAEEARWIERIKNIGPEKAYRELKDEYATRDFGIQHHIAHIFGTALYGAQGIEGLSTCDSSFAFGCYHSFFGAALKENGPGIIERLDAVCIEKFGPHGTGCQHGIGHGLMEFFGSKQLPKALEACTKTDQPNELFGCTSGVFMEYNFPVIITDAETSLGMRSFDEKNPYAPCSTIVPEEFRRSCYYELPQWLEKVPSINHDYTAVGKLCAGIEELSYQESCFFGVGNVAAPFTRYNASSTIEKCQSMPTALGRLDCRAGATWSFFGNPEVRSLASYICQGYPAEAKERCHKASDLFGNKEIFQYLK